MEIEISEYKVLIDDEDWERVSRYKWYVSENNKYVFANIYCEGTRKTVSLHRLILDCNDTKQVVDHINHNTFDNRKVNLRMCKQVQNTQNKRMPSHNTTGYKGVRKRKHCSRYTAVVREGKDSYTCGFYNTPEEAARAYDMMSIYLFKEFAYTNFNRELYNTTDIDDFAKIVLSHKNILHKEHLNG